MPSPHAVPDFHAHPRHASLLDWLTVAVWLLVSVGFVASLLAPVRGRAEPAADGCYAACSPASTSSSAPRKAST